MKASEVAAKLLELAEAHSDPHVYAYTQTGDCVQAVESETVICIDMGVGLSPVIIIVGQPWDKSKDVQAFLAEAL